jgi:F-box protein 18 (helicase)
VGWVQADCTRLLRDGDEASRVACVFTALTKLDSLFGAPPPACAAAAQAAFCATLRPVLPTSAGPDAAPFGFADIVAAGTGLAVSIIPPRLADLAARSLRRGEANAAPLGFWASAGLLFLTASSGSFARAVVRWLHALPFAEPDDRATANEFVYALTALLAAPVCAEDAGAHSLAADLRSQTQPRIDACLLPPPPGRRLTREQAAVVDAEFAPGDVAKVVAFAGAGKTSTLRALAEAHPDWRILYTAFNSSVVHDGKRAFEQLRNVTCATTHVVATPARNALQSGVKRLRTNAMSVKDVCATFPGFAAKDLCPALVAADTFMVSDAEQVEARHVPTRSNGDLETIITLANRMVTRMLDPEDAFPFTFNAYLRKFVLSAPRLPYDCILVDESQDLNPITTRLFLEQTHARRIFVGDSHQHIYAFNGTRDCLATLPVTASFRLTRCFRFGPDLAAVADKILYLKGERTPLRGGRGRVTVVDESDELLPEHLDGAGCVLGVVRFNVSWIELAAQVCARGGQVYIETPAAARKFLDMAEDVYKVSQGQGRAVSQANKFRIGQYQSLGDLEDEARESSSADLLIMASFVRKHLQTFPALMQQLRAGFLETQDGARALLSTAHKAKGCEHDHIFVCSDLSDVVHKHTHLGPVQKSDHDEINLLYVAITRARLRVTLPTRLLQRLDTYARLRYIPDAVDPAVDDSSCTDCNMPVRGAYLATCGSAGGPLSRTCAACPLQIHSLGHGVMHCALLQHLALG